MSGDHDENMADLSGDASLADQLARMRDQRDKAMRDLYEVKHKRIDYLEAVWAAVAESMHGIVIKPVKAPTKATAVGARGIRGPEEVAVALLSDLQTGKITPDYNSDVCRERVMRYAEKIVKITNVQRADHPVRECIVPMLGDFVEGVDIFPGQQWLIDSTLYRQVFDSTPSIVVDFLRHLLANFDTVRAVAVQGNHGRIGRKGMFGPEDNADRMVYRVIALMMRDEPRFTMEMADPVGERAWYKILEIGSYRALLIHGDQIRGSMGFPWYGLCVPEEAEILTRSGWKTHKELSTGDIALTFDPVTYENRWEPVQAVNTFPWSGDLMEVNGIPVTPDHRWPVQSAHDGRQSMIATKDINTNHKVPLHGHYHGTDSVLTPRLAAILGWIVTDGTARWIGTRWEAGIYQSAKDHKFLSEIEALTGSMRRKKYNDRVCYVPVLMADKKALIAAGYRNKEDLPSIVTMLSREAAEAMADAMYKAEGDLTGTQDRFSQRPGPVADAYEILSALTGRTVSVHHDADDMLRMTHRKSDFVYPARDGGMALIPYEGTAWCPTTETGTWWVRYRGRIMPTGNSKKVHSWASGGLGEDSTFQDVMMGHYHSLAMVPLNKRKAWANGSTESTNTFASEMLAAQSDPSQWLLFVNPEAGRVTGSYGVDLK